MQKTGREDCAVLECLLRKYESKLYNFVRSKCSNPSDVDDLVQETHLQAMLSIGNFSGKSCFSTWLMGIALNLIRNCYNRSPEYRYSMLDSEVLQQFESEELTPECYAEQYYRLHQLQNQVQALPELSREMITLLVDDGISYEQLAERYGVSVSSVKSRLFRTREQLREAVL